MTTLLHEAWSLSLRRNASALSLSLLMVAGALFAAPSVLAQQEISTSGTAGEQGQQTIIHITKDGTNSYLLSGGSSSIGTFDTGYRIAGERSAVRASEELIITTVTEDFMRSPIVGYVTAGTTSTNAGGPSQNTTGATLPNPFATPEQITERIASELRTVIGSAEDNTTPQGQLVEIKCDFGMALDDMRCFHAPSVGETGGTTRPAPSNNTGEGGGNNTDPLTVQAQIADIDQEETSLVLFETSIDGGTSPYTCEWDLGDGTTSDECGPNDIYENVGTYTATVTVTDSAGQTASDSTEPFTITNTTGGGETTTPPPGTNATAGGETTTPPPGTNATAGGETTTPPETVAPPSPTTGEGEESITTPATPPGAATPDTQDVPVSDPDADRPAPPSTGEGEETTTNLAGPP